METNLRVALAASSGGHLSQLLKLADAWRGYDTFIVTTTDVVRDNLRKFGTTYVVGECNRQHPLRVLRVLLRCIDIVRRERPDVVVSTGAAPACLLCLLARLRGARIVWMDSITNVERLSLSGRLIRPLADLFLVQWPELAARYPGVEYVGATI